MSHLEIRKIIFDNISVNIPSLRPDQTITGDLYEAGEPWRAEFTNQAQKNLSAFAILSTGSSGGKRKKIPKPALLIRTIIG